MSVNTDSPKSVQVRKTRCFLGNSINLFKPVTQLTTKKVFQTKFT